MKRYLLIAVFLTFAQSAQATITRVAHAINSGTAVTTATGITVTVTSTGAGHALIADCMIRDGAAGAVVAVTDNQSETWVNPSASNGTDTFYNGSSWYVLSSTAGVTAVTFKPSGGGGTPYQFVGCGVMEYSTNLSSFALDLGQYQQGLVASGNETLSITTTGSSDVIVAMASENNSDFGSPLAPFVQVDTTAVRGVQNQDLINTGAATYTAGWSLGAPANGNQYSMTAVALKEVSAAGFRTQVGAFTVGP